MPWMGHTLRAREILALLWLLTEIDASWGGGGLGTESNLSTSQNLVVDQADMSQYHVVGLLGVRLAPVDQKSPVHLLLEGILCLIAAWV